MDDKIVFGCTTAESKAGIDRLVKGYFGNVNLSLMSILSDVQELIARPDPDKLEQARQYINRVKQAVGEAAPIELWRQGQRPRRMVAGDIE